MGKNKKIYQNLPETPGVYLMKDKNQKILYIGKAANLKRRVSSYFLKTQDLRIEELLKRVEKIDYLQTETAIEALILEANLIKKYQPPFNIKEKDDKSFLFIEITNEKFPRVLLVRKKDKINGERFGPFTSASQLRESLKIIRKIFPFNTHPPKEINSGKPCFDWQIGLCPGTCIGNITFKAYQKTIKNIRLFLSGKKATIIKNLEKEMKQASKKLNFELANEKKRQILALKHIQDVALISQTEILPKTEIQKRIEGYDISNLGGKEAVGSMVVFINHLPAKKEYRLFKIKTVQNTNDVLMLKEVLERRLKHFWPLPDLILVDGGKAQVNTIKKVIQNFHLKIPVIGIAKGPKRKNNQPIGKIPSFTSLQELIQVRNEAHRFAINYHRKLRNKNFIHP
jgi:excinuclease ABC subunit C